MLHAMELKSWELRDAFSSWQTLCRKDSLLHRILAHMDGQFRTRRAMLFDIILVVLKCVSQVLLGRTLGSPEVQYLAPMILSRSYMRTGRTQHSAMLRDERGFSKPCRYPVDCGEESMCFMVHSVTYFFLLEGAESYQTPRHWEAGLTNWNTGWRDLFLTWRE